MPRLHFAILGFVVVSGFAAPASAQNDARLAEARRACWAEVGIHGDPQQSRYAYKFGPQVTTCVQQRMRGGGGGGGGGGQPRR